MMKDMRFFFARMAVVLLAASFPCATVQAAQAEHAGLPPAAEVARALAGHLGVREATNALAIEHTNRRKWDSGSHEFNLRIGSAQRKLTGTGEKQGEWDVELERALRLPGKVGLDADIGAASVARAEYALGDARHEAGRLLLRLWFTWQREQAQAGLWQRQVGNLERQAALTEKRLQAGDAPRLELNQARAAVAQAALMARQANLRSQLAATELAREFPEVSLPEAPPTALPQPIGGDITFWKQQVLEHNHELGMAQAETRVQQLLAQRSRADRVPDPTLGLRYSSEAGGSERVAGVYVSVPLSFGQRSATAEAAAQQAVIAADREAFIRRKLDREAETAWLGADNLYAAWQQAAEAAEAMRNNAGLVEKAYALGESNLLDSLAAQRLAQESALAETLARLDANEARYRLMLDAHQLWPLDAEGEDDSHDHY